LQILEYYFVPVLPDDWTQYKFQPCLKNINLLIPFCYRSEGALVQFNIFFLLFYIMY
jgi:hypothetical protein